MNLNWIYVKKDHMTRFFGTNWNSRISLKRWHRNSLKKRGLYFHNGYVELYFDKWVLRYKNNK
jgi:hypothetical protein